MPSGFMLLAGRLREVGDEQVVLDVIQKHFKRRVQPLQLFGQDGGQGSLASHDCLQVLRTTLPAAFSHLVWTAELLRMAVLTYRAISFDEPVLLVGNTGCDDCNLTVYVYSTVFLSYLVQLYVWPYIFCHYKCILIPFMDSTTALCSDRPSLHTC